MTQSPQFIAYFLLAFLAFLPLKLHAEVIDRVVAVVNEEPVTLFDVDKLMATKIDEIKKAESKADKQDKFENYRDLALKSLIDEKLLLQAMKKQSITVTDPDVQRAFDNILERNKLSKEQLAEQLQKKGIAFNSYMEELRSQLGRVKFMGQVIAPRVKVTDGDLDDFFASNSDKFAAYQTIRMGQIILPLSPGASDDEILSAKKKADEVIARAKKGENFEDLGKQYSQNPSTAVPMNYQTSQLAAPLVEALSETKNGDVSEPVRSEMGLHIIKVYERSTLQGEEFKAIREQIREKVFEVKLEEELQKYLDDLKNKSYIQVKKSS
jgi:Parvulin-like peptidyl-prolyl isomerase